MSSANNISRRIKEIQESEGSDTLQRLRALQTRLQESASPNPPRTRRNPPPRTRRNQRISPNQQQNQGIPLTREGKINFLNNLPIVGEIVIPGAENSITYEPISDNDEIFILHGLKQYPYTKDIIIELLLKPNPRNPFTRESITEESITKYRLRNPLNNKTIGGKKKTHKKSHKTHKKSKRN
jgi:hypothetical protein